MSKQTSIKDCKRCKYHCMMKHNQRDYCLLIGNYCKAVRHCNKATIVATRTKELAELQASL